MIAKRQIAAKTPYAPYVMRLIFSCVALDDKKAEGWRRNGVKNQYLCRIISICSTLQCILRGLICRLTVLRDAESNIKSNIKSNISPSLLFGAFGDSDQDLCCRNIWRGGGLRN